MSKLNISISFLFTLLFVGTSAQDITFNASASRNRVAAGEQFQISFTLNTAGSNFKAPSLSEFDVYSGPNQSTSMQFINGNVSQSISYSFIVAAKKEGKFTIGPASITVNGKKVETKPLTIEVSKSAGGNQAQQNQPQQGSGQRPAAGQDLGDDIFLKCSVNKNKAYVGEQLIATFKIYTRVNIIDNGISQTPTMTGFWTEDITSKSKQVKLYTENYEGVAYQVAEIKKAILFPQRTGTLEIDPLEMECIVRQRVSPRSHSIFDQFFGGGYQDIKVVIRTKPVKVQVVALPEQGKPENFNGAVGNFSIASKINKDKVKTNEAVNYSFTVSGKGNLKLLDAVKPDFPPDIETYDPKISDNITATSSGLSGSRTYEFLLIPRHAGEFTIKSLDFTYFDPEKKDYITLKSAEFPLAVEKGKDTEQTVFTPAAKEDVRVVGTDIRFIKSSAGELRAAKETFFGSTAYYTFLTAPLLLFGAILFARKKHIAERSDVVGFKQRQANKVARKRLSVAQQFLQQKNYQGFYEEMYRAIIGYLSDKLHLSLSGFSKTAIASSLEQRGASNDTITKVTDLIDKCEFARYAPLKDFDGMEHSYTDAVDLISKIEQEIK